MYQENGFSEMESPACIVCGSKNNSELLKVRDRFSSGSEEYSIVKCECGFVFLSPRPDEQEISKYYDHMSYEPHRSEKKSIFDHCYRLVQNWAVDWKRKKIENYISCGKLLDIGGGAGEFCQHMTKHGWSTIVQDTSESALILAEQKGIPGVQHLDLIAGKYRFDLITMWHALEHVHDVETLFSNINNLLRPGGVLVIAVPNHNAPEREKLGNKWAPYDTPRHLYHFDFDSLRRFQSKYDFEIIGANSLYQDTAYNILLSWESRGVADFIKMAFLWLTSLFKNVTGDVKSSSSMMIICRRK